MPTFNHEDHSDLHTCPLGGLHDFLGGAENVADGTAGGAICSKCGNWSFNGWFDTPPPTKDRSRES